MKWQVIGAMVLLFLLGAWLVAGPNGRLRVEGLRPGATTKELLIGDSRGVLEIVNEGRGEHSFRLLFRNGHASGEFGDAEFKAALGQEIYDSIVEAEGNPLFRLFNITSWWSFLWISVGLAGQAAFFARMAVQWLVSEKERRSVVPDAFWWLSLGGGIALFAYFVWRQDIIGVLGQTTGVVIYARNIRLIYKQHRLEAGGEPAGAAAGSAMGG